MATVLIDSPKDNRILAALPSGEYGQLMDDLEFVHLELGQVLFDSGRQRGYVYFPTTCIVSLIYATENGSSAELAIAGNDGLVGITMVLGGHTTTHQAIVQSAGNAFRLKSNLTRWELDQGGSLLPLALRYTQAKMTQMAQSVVCNRHHSVLQQLCRWILLSLDRLPGNQLNMTKELIANMLGVRREAVTESAGKLQKAGLIQYHRGRITIRDRAGIEALACECYSVVKQEQDRLFNLVPDLPGRDQPRPTLATLRKRAEIRLQEARSPSPIKESDSITLIHELQVHHIEVEIQLKELHRACAEADALRDRYADIYDSAPVNYFTLNGQGEIMELNLAGDILLGIKRSNRPHYRFVSSLAAASHTEFNRFLTEVLNAKCKKICEVTLLPTPQRAESIVRIEAVPDENGDECRMVVIDVTAERQAEKLMIEREHHLHTLVCPSQSLDGAQEKKRVSAPTLGRPIQCTCSEKAYAVDSMGSAHRSRGASPFYLSLLKQI
jgi:CRP-like cAMP-binding protein